MNALSHDGAPSFNRFTSSARDQEWSLLAPHLGFIQHNGCMKPEDFAGTTLLRRQERGFVVPADRRARPRWISGQNAGSPQQVRPGKVEVLWAGREVTMFAEDFETRGETVLGANGS
jgi:hypothetical protein